MNLNKKITVMTTVGMLFAARFGAFGNVTNLLGNAGQGEILGYSIGATLSPSDARILSTRESSKVEFVAPTATSSNRVMSAEIRMENDAVTNFVSHAGVLYTESDRRIVGVWTWKRYTAFDLGLDYMKAGTPYYAAHEYLFSRFGLDETIFGYSLTNRGDEFTTIKSLTGNLKMVITYQNQEGLELVFYDPSIVRMDVHMDVLNPGQTYESPIYKADAHTGMSLYNSLTSSVGASE